MMWVRYFFIVIYTFNHINSQQLALSEHKNLEKITLSKKAYLALLLKAILIN